MSRVAEKLAELRQRRKVIANAIDNALQAQSFSAAGATITRLAPVDLRRELVVTDRAIAQLEGAEMGRPTSPAAVGRRRAPGA